MSSFTPDDFKLSKGEVQRVYDTSYYGYDLIFNLHQMNPVVLTNVVNSAAATTFTFVNTTNMPIRGNNPSLLSNKDSIIVAGPTAKTDLDVIFEVTPDMDALVHEVNLLIPVALNIDTYDSGNPVLNSVSLTTTYENTGEIITQLTNTWTTGLSALSAPGCQIFVVNVTINPYGLTLLKGRSILLEIKTSSSFGTGNTTGHAGLCQDISYGKQISPAAPIYYYPASFFAHIHPPTSHTNPNYVGGEGQTP